MKRFFIIVFLILPAFSTLMAQSFFNTERLKINSRSFNEFGPVLVDTTLYFCSDRKTSYTENVMHDNKIVYLYNIFVVKDTALMRISDLPKGINTLSNDGPLCFSPDGKEMYVSHNFTAEPGVLNLSKVGLYYYKKDVNGWGERTPFMHNNTSWNTGHPSISPDGKTLYFASDKPGGQGGFDIYFCRKENGEWSLPVNAGPAINSAKNEITPFFHASHKLYFASDRDSLMGFDVYASVLESNNFSTVEKLDEPINSKYNDFSFVCNATGEAGYFASNRQKTDDIYSFRSTFPDFATCDSLKINNYCFTFFEQNTYDLDTMALMYEWDFGDKKIRKKEADYCFAGPGTYEVSLNIIDSITGEVYQNQANYSMDIKDEIQPVITAPEHIKAGADVVFNSDKSNLPGYEIQGFYWRFDDGAKLTGPQASHRFAKAGEYKVWLGVILKDTANQSTLKKCVFMGVSVIQ